MKWSETPRISLVHYWFFEVRGGEHVINNIGKAVPLNHVYSLLGHRDVAGILFGHLAADFSFLNRFPAVDRYYRSLLPLFPLAARSLRIEDCDVLISSESGPAKAVKAPENALHICYCHTPMRYLWSHHDEYLKSLGPGRRAVFKLITPMLRRWDRVSAQKVHFFIANSRTVQKRIKRYYNRDSVVINPPVRFDMFSVHGSKADYYLVLSALVAYKRVDLVVRAFNELGYPLKIAGAGPLYTELRKMAKSNIEFLGHVDDEKLPELYALAKALVFPGEEDFGITPLEAQACGTPVIAFRKGGVTETVLDGNTGMFFDFQNVNSIIDAVESFERHGVEYSPSRIRRTVAHYSEEAFQKEFRDFVYSKWKEFAVKIPC